MSIRTQLRSLTLRSVVAVHAERSSVKRSREQRPILHRRVQPRVEPHLEPAIEEERALLESLVARVESKWESVPGRYRIVALCCAAFMLCNMDKVNLSLAIIPMAQTFGWPASISGLIQSSFFWGYMAFQIPGGYLCSRFGGRRMMPYAVGIWSLATLAVPFIGGTVGGLCAARAAVGLGEAVAPSAITDMVARTVPISERSRVTSFIFGGLSAGSILALFFSSIFIEHFGWESVFLMFALGGGLWVYAFSNLMRQFRSEDPKIEQQLTMDSGASEDGVPIRGILRSRPVWALAFTHFCANYFHYTMLTWLPSFFSKTLQLDVSQAALVSVIPPILSISFAAVAGSLADKLVEMGWETTKVRKLCQSLAFLGPSACLLGATLSNDAAWTAGFVALSLGLASFSMAGLYCNHQDLSPKYSSFLLGFTNTAASIPGIVGVWLTGCLLDKWGSWELALFFPSVFFFLLGTFCFLTFGTSQEQSFKDNSPFEIEHRIREFFQLGSA